jgi:hypothetical protein
MRKGLPPSDNTSRAHCTCHNTNTLGSESQSLRLLPLLRHLREASTPFIVGRRPGRDRARPRSVHWALAQATATSTSHIYSHSTCQLAKHHTLHSLSPHSRSVTPCPSSPRLLHSHKFAASNVCNQLLPADFTLTSLHSHSFRAAQPLSAVLAITTLSPAIDSSLNPRSLGTIRKHGPTQRHRHPTTLQHLPQEAKLQRYQPSTHSRSKQTASQQLL